MVVIALDTSHTVGSVALARDGEVIADARFGEAASHLVGLGGAVDRLLHAQGMAAHDIARVALVAGPGSFTGLRIGLAWVKGLHAALEMELVTMGTLELLALPHLHDVSPVCAMVDALRDEVYAAVYRGDSDAQREVPVSRAIEMMAPVASAPQVFVDSLTTTPALFVGTGVTRYRSLLKSGRFSNARLVDGDPHAYPSARHLAAIAHRLTPLPRESVASLEPFYLRGSAARPRRLRPIEP